MPTKHRRIAVTVDPKLADALGSASRKLPGLSDAALIKELALRGASSLNGGTKGGALERILDRPGVITPSRKLSSVLRGLEQHRRLSSKEVDRILDEDRADRELS